MSDDDKAIEDRAAAIDAVARQREGGEPSEYGLREATRFVDDLLAALPHLATNAELPGVTRYTVHFEDGSERSYVVKP